MSASAEWRVSLAHDYATASDPQHERSTCFGCWHAAHNAPCPEAQLHLPARTQGVRMKIIKLTASNVKRLRAVEITPDVIEDGTVLA